MSTYDPTAHQANDSTVRRAYIHLGIDNNGSHHVAHTPSETIRIVHPDGSRTIKGFSEGPVDGLDDYVEFIAELGGWSDRRYGRDLLGSVIDAHRETER